MWSESEGDSPDVIRILGLDPDSCVPCARHQVDTIVDYLVHITGSDLNDPTKLATLLLLSQMFDQDTNQIARLASLRHEVLPGLLTMMDNVFQEENPSHAAELSESRLLISVISLKIFWRLSQLPVAQQQTLISAPIMRLLLAYLDPESNIYRFPPEMTKKFCKYAQGKLLVGQVRKEGLTSNLTEYIHRHASDSKLSRLSMPSEVHMCSLYDTSDPEKDFNIGENLVQRGLAWPQLSTKTQTDNVEGAKQNDQLPIEESNWVDLLILRVVQGPIFWAYIGEESAYVQTVQSIHNQSSSPSTAEMVPLSTVKIGEYVLVKRVHRPSDTTSISTVNYFRCQVVRVHGNTFDMFAVDHGIILRGVSASCVYQLPSTVSIMERPPLASLCVVKGLQPPAIDPSLPQMAAASLCNLCRFSVAAGELLTGPLSDTEVLMRMLKCPDRRVLIQIVQTFNNLACNGRVQKELNCDTLIPALLEILIGLSEDWCKEGVSLDLTESCLFTLCTLLSLNPKPRSTFYQNDGLRVMLKIVLSEPSPRIYQQVMKVLRMYLHDATLRTRGDQQSRMGRLISDKQGQEAVRPHRSRSVGRPSLEREHRRRHSVGGREMRQSRADNSAVEITLRECRLSRDESSSDEEQYHFKGKKLLSQKCDIDHQGAVSKSAGDVNQASSSDSDVNNDDIISKLLEMGFPPDVCRKAARHAGNGGVEQALTWIMEHLQDPDFDMSTDDPPGAACAPTEVFSPDKEALVTVMSMGVTQEQASRALKATNNNVEEAVDWIILNAEELARPMGNGVSATNQKIPTRDVSSENLANFSHLGRYLVSVFTGRKSPKLQPVDASSVYQGSEDVYVVDTAVGFEQDGRHEMRTNHSITHVSVVIISEIVCGFLNSGVEGRIIFGVFDRRVHGICLTREERDQFRLGVDRMMVDNLLPSILHSMFDITYSPVVRPRIRGAGRDKEPVPIQDTFIVELIVRPNKATLYTLRNGQCYYRFGPNNARLNTQEVRQLIMIEEEFKRKEEINNLKGELNALKHILISLPPAEQ